VPRGKAALVLGGAALLTQGVSGLVWLYWCKQLS
jgi:hypothetical protein